MDCFKKNPAYKSLNSSSIKQQPIIINKHDKLTFFKKWFY